MDTKRGKPVVLPQLAAYLKQVRTNAKRGGQKAIAKRAKALGLTLVTLNRLKQAEAGIVSDVDPLFLQQLAAIYQKPYGEFVSQLVQEKYGTPLPSGVVRSNQYDHLSALADQLCAMQDSAFRLFEVIRDARALVGPNGATAERRTGRDRRAGWPGRLRRRPRRHPRKQERQP